MEEEEEEEEEERGYHDVSACLPARCLAARRSPGVRGVGQLLLKTHIVMQRTRARQPL